MAKKLNIPISQATVIEDKAGIHGLLVERFDRVPSKGASSPRAMEDGAQVMGIYPARKYAVTSEELCTSLLQHVHAPMVAARNLYLQFVFAWLTGNGDLHAKNISILQDHSGAWEIAPVYDIPCTAVYGDMTMALPIAGRTSHIRARHWNEFAESLGLPIASAHSLNELALRVTSMIDLQSLPFSGSPLRAAERELRHRRGELSG